MKLLCVNAYGAETVLTEGKEYDYDGKAGCLWVALTDDKGNRNYFNATRFMRSDTVCAVDPTKETDQ